MYFKASFSSLVKGQYWINQEHMNGWFLRHKNIRMAAPVKLRRCHWSQPSQGHGRQIPHGL